MFRRPPGVQNTLYRVLGDSNPFRRLDKNRLVVSFLAELLTPWLGMILCIFVCAKDFRPQQVVGAHVSWWVVFQAVKLLCPEVSGTNPGRESRPCTQQGFIASTRLGSFR